ncbi:MAG: LacI family DNA-binding transcriptional regulator [Ideonella sp.]|nr:LacI family DNA-binding transcriptional regulator [Ideonella sp.]
MPALPSDLCTRPSVGDVARLAGVSPATVSRAFNAPTLLVPQTLERVQRAANQLGYQPYGLARARCAGVARWCWASSCPRCATPTSQARSSCCRTSLRARATPCC